MYTARRQKNLKVIGNNENFLKKAGKGTIPIPEQYQNQLPNHGIRIALRYATGWYQGMMQPMVSLYLFDRKTGERSLLETLVLTPTLSGRDSQVEPLLKTNYTHNYEVSDIKRDISYQINNILQDYLAKQNMSR